MAEKELKGTEEEIKSGKKVLEFISTATEQLHVAADMMIQEETDYTRESILKDIILFTDTVKSFLQAIGATYKIRKEELEPLTRQVQAAKLLEALGPELRELFKDLDIEKVVISKGEDMPAFIQEAIKGLEGRLAARKPGGMATPMGMAEEPRKDN